MAQANLVCVSDLPCCCSTGNSLSANLSLAALGRLGVMDYLRAVPVSDLRFSVDMQSVVLEQQRLFFCACR